MTDGNAEGRVLPPTVRGFIRQADSFFGWLRAELPEDRRKDPELEAAMERVKAHIAETGNLYEYGVCVHCGQPIHSPRGETWIHTPQPGWHDPDDERVGCRAASFSRLGHWDDDLDARWKATPARV